MVQRVRVRYAKRGRLRFASHRDFARAFERALRRAAVPVAFSAGFSPHPRVSYVGAAPTGVASEAEYLEVALSARVDVAQLCKALDAALPAGLDVLECVGARGGTLADMIDASHWRIELPGVDPADVDVEVLGRELVLSGIRKPPHAEGRLYQQIEIEHGAFHREIALGAEVDEAGTTATYKDGVLQITLPLVATQERTRRVPIAEQRS